MTRLEIALKVWQTFVIEGKPQSMIGTSCVYYSDHAPHGCAVGCLLSLEQRQEIPPGSVMGTPNVRSCLKAAGFEEALPFLIDLQYWHDEPCFGDRDILRCTIKKHLTPEDFATFETWVEDKQ